MRKSSTPEEVHSDLVKLLRMEEKLFARLDSLRHRGCGDDYERKLDEWQEEHLAIKGWAERMLQLPEIAQAKGRSGRLKNGTSCLSFIPGDLFSDYVEMRILESISSYICETMLPSLMARTGALRNHDSRVADGEATQSLEMQPSFELAS